MRVHRRSAPSIRERRFVRAAAALGVLLIACAEGGPGSDDGDDDGDGGGGGADWELGPPLATDAPPFEPRPHSLAPPDRLGDRAAPYPTNVWWQDVALGGTTPIGVLPYQVRAIGSGLLASMPRIDVAQRTVSAVFEADLSLEVVEAATGPAWAADDLLSTTLRWDAGGGSLTAPLVRGMPYVTGVYAGATPRLASIHAVLTVDGAAAGGAVEGERFVLTMNNGQTWAVYAAPAIAFTATASGLVATAPYDGVLRVAVVPDDAALAVLDAHAGAYPIGGEVGAAIHGDRGELSLRWRRAGDGPLLMAAMPHHLDQLEGERTALAFATLRGEMRGVGGDAWTLVDEMPTITWRAPTAPDADERAAIAASLVDDAAVRPTAEDPYFFGKQVARMGRLALIADELDDAATAADLRAAMADQLEPWLTGTNPSPLRHETVWGGLCSQAGLDDPGADFGNGWYNDHHFHYGYFLYAAAALGVGDPAWLDEHRAALYALARDVANPSADDPYFTRFRHMDWFEGHSWAAGLFPFADGRNQESSSEAVNAYYGLMLLGHAFEDANMAGLGRLMLATELRGAQTYWQIRADRPIYPAPFDANKAVGVLWSNKVDYLTFFGLDVELIHGIQMLPFTPATEHLLPAGWIAEEYPVLATALDGGIEEGWRGFVYLAHAILDPAAAWDEVQTLTAFDDGNSRTNSLYWVATRPEESAP